MKRDEDVQDLFERAVVKPTAAEREAILAAAEPILAEHAASAGGRSGTPPIAERLRALLVPRRLAFAGAVALAAAIILLGRGTPPTDETRSAPLRSWAEHTQEDPGRPFPLVAERIGRAY